MSTQYKWNPSLKFHFILMWKPLQKNRSSKEYQLAYEHQKLRTTEIDKKTVRVNKAYLKNRWVLITERVWRRQRRKKQKYFNILWHGSNSKIILRVGNEPTWFHLEADDAVRFLDSIGKLEHRHSAAKWSKKCRYHPTTLFELELEKKMMWVNQEKLLHDFFLSVVVHRGSGCRAVVEHMSCY